MEQHMSTESWRGMTGELVTRIDALWPQAVEIWLAGGWAMGAIALTSLIMFGLGVHIHLKLRAKRFQSLKESRWRSWIDKPELRKGPIGELLDFAVGARTLKENSLRFEELQATETKPFVRDLRVMKICISAAVLLGLLGTVTGMLGTFGAMSDGTGGEKTMDLIAKGVSQALVTTETGLVIALAGLFFQYQLVQKHDRYKAFLAHLETVCAQKVHAGTTQMTAPLKGAATKAKDAENTRRVETDDVLNVNGEPDTELPVPPANHRRLSDTAIHDYLSDRRSMPTHEPSEPETTWDDSANQDRTTAARTGSTSRR